MRRSVSVPSGGSSHTRAVFRPVEAIPEGSPPTNTVPQDIRRPPVRRNTVEDALDTLKKYDTVIVVDDSGSMQGSRWTEVCAVFVLFYVVALLTPVLPTF